MQFSLGSLCPSILRLIGLRCPIKKARTLALAKPDLKERCTLPKVGTVLYRLRMSFSFPMNVITSDYRPRAKERCSRPSTILAALLYTVITGALNL